MSNKPLTISLVIPAYNEESHLAACLQSALAQSRPFDEIIVVDNNSSDNTARIATQFAEVRLLHERRQGIVYARDCGFSAARSDIIARVDADCTLPDNWAAHILDYYANPAHTATAWTGGGHFYNVRLPYVVSFFYSLLAFRINALLTGYPTLWGSNMALPKKQWELVRRKVCRRVDIHEDLDLTTHLYRNGIRIHYDSTVVMFAQMRRVRSRRDELWSYLQWWPRTLRVHDQKSWLLCWLVGVLPIYLGVPLLALGEHAARLARLRPLHDKA